MKKLIENGEMFGTLRIVGFSHIKNKSYYYIAVCVVCDFSRAYRADKLREGRSLICNCNNHRRKIQMLNGLSKLPEYFVWCRMISRCNNAKDKDYKNYGGRGITVCEQWASFCTFIEEMGRRPSSKYSIDRIDNNKGYSPENCRWATRIEQNNNRRNNRTVFLNGQTKSITSWARELGIKFDTVYSRLRAGWSPEKALTTPIKIQN